MRKIPIAIPYLGKEEAQAAYDTILSGWVTQGPRVEEFENNFSNYIGSKYAVAVSSCTTALHLSLICKNVGPGDEVICPSMSFIATVNTIKYVGAIPVFAEVKDDYNLDIEDVLRRITKKTKAIILVHQIGNPGEIDSFQKLCKEKNIELIEDAACAIGSAYKGAKIGSHSDLVCFSFHPRKVITTGDGGMITTSNKDYYERLKRLRQHGMTINDRERHGSKTVVIEQYDEVGYNYRMTDIQASIGIQQLKRLDEIVEARREIANKYIMELKRYDFIRLPIEPKGVVSNYQSFSIYLDSSCPVSRNEFMQLMLDKGISTRRGIMTAHREPAYKYMNSDPLLKTEDLADNSVLLPLYYPMSDDEFEYVISCMHEILS
ncbi:MAG: DegT/DnrJ/EryC1/StrS family aminotransferase [Bacteroidetes bacterium]|nr:DegT/DnrJ/EryC1/StrS family aminotransferase [Bacteroidota bacterium]